MTEQSDHHANDPNAETSIALTPLERELPANDDEPRMDSGCDAWLAVLGSWILIFNSWFASQVSERIFTAELKLALGDCPTHLVSFKRIIKQ